jgi:predicted Rossmann fold flavoprotein
MMNVAVIGAGASGMVAALQAAWHGAEVTLFERNSIPGRKLLVTGSGRCNITNAAVSASRYTCADPSWLASLLEGFGVPEFLEMLHEIGIPVQSTSDGWYYPLSDSAQNVADAFGAALLQAGIKLQFSTQVISIRAMGEGFSIRCVSDKGEREQSFERVIVSTGGMAYPELGSRGELFAELGKLGHGVLPKRPALAPVLADLGDLKVLQGVRLDAGVTLWQGKERLGFAAGNLIFTQWGLNGPAVMDISHHISALPQAELNLSLNLLEFCQKDFDDLLARKRFTPLPLRVFLGAFLPPKAAVLYVRLMHLGEHISLQKVDDAAITRLVEKLNDTRLPVKGVRGFEFCQVSAGGVPVNEADPHTLESRLVKGLYLTGEVLDVVGPCGGYNLQFAFSSGALAGLAAADNKK